MKKLQNNFTNPEQSKRLLELGVPVDSADCYIRLDFNVTESPDIIRYGAIFSEVKKRNEIIDKNFIPCWSVGRMMEIIGTCAIFPPHGSSIFMHDESDYIGHLVRTLEKHIEWFDFSKLEE